MPTWAIAMASAAGMLVADGGWARLPDMVSAWVTAAPWVAAWILSAAGLGRGAARHAGLRGSAESCAIGACLMLVLDQFAATAGLLSVGRLPAIAILGPGWWLLSRARTRQDDLRMPWAASLPLGLACGVLLAAAAVPTGFLWSTEFGGFDALSYHLQLPKEWIAAGSMRPLPHAAYSGFPSFVEGAFMHLMAMRQDPRDAAIACQLLHASLMVIAAAMLGRVAARVAGSATAGAATMVAAIGTPWLLATGALPYSEAGVLLGLAVMLASVLVARPWIAGMLLGLGAAVAVGSKASSVVLAVPWTILAWPLLRRPRFDARSAIAAAAVAALAMSPWALRNAWCTGDPLFPLGGATPAGWWTAEQASRWTDAHSNHESWIERLHALWRQGPLFGVGANPRTGEPWQPMWALLPLAGMVAMALRWRSSNGRAWAAACLVMLAGTSLAWMAGTHLQSRFLIPAAVPLTIAVGLEAADLATRGSRWRRGLAWGGVLWGLLSVWVCLRDFDGALRLSGQVTLASGDIDLALLGGAEGEAVAAEVRAHPSVEAALGGLFPGQRTLAIGWSTPFWLRPGAPLHWSTVWDANPIETAMRQPDPAAWLGERFDLVLVDWPMLERWQRSGWLSPAMDPQAIASILRGREHMSLAGERELFTLHERLRPTWPSPRRAGPDDRSY